MATNSPGSPIHVGDLPNAIAITPDGNTAYVANGNDGATPIDLATNTPGTPIPVGGSGSRNIAITPDGKTAYVTNSHGWVTPIAIATNTPGSPIPVGAGPFAVAITPAPHPVSTSTQLSVSPPTSAAAGTTETLTVAVTPAVAASTVQFTDGTTPIGGPVTVANGTASTTTTLTSGIHALTAVFTPTDSTKFGSSTSNTVSYVVNAPSGAKATTTTLRVFPNRAVESIPVVLLANVTPRGATGTVQFIDGATALGTPVPVTAGFAITIVTLPKGNHSLTAVFTPTDPAAYAQSTSSPVPLTVGASMGRVTLR